MRAKVDAEMSEQNRTEDEERDMGKNTMKKNEGNRSQGMIKEDENKEE